MKYVFVCGLHRSGTTILAREIGKLGNCTSFQDTGVPMDEGQWLQDLYPVDQVYGGPGRFGFAAQAHLTESSSLLTAANVRRLRETWECHWADRKKTIRVEKTPANLIMTRFLQAAFENAYFIVIKRHPVAVSLATQKWCKTSFRSLFDHWLRCHEIFKNDKTKLKHVYELKYEEFLNDPAHYLAEIADFIGTNKPTCPISNLADAHNRKYLNQWEWMLGGSPYRAYYRYLAQAYEASFAAFDYPAATSEKTGVSANRINRARRIGGLALCVGADMEALWRRKWANLGLRAARLVGRSKSGMIDRGLVKDLDQQIRMYNAAGLRETPRDQRSRSLNI